MATLSFAPAGLDAVVSFYALIHNPLWNWFVPAGNSGHSLILDRAGAVA